MTRKALIIAATMVIGAVAASSPLWLSKLKTVSDNCSGEAVVRCAAIAERARQAAIIESFIKYRPDDAKPAIQLADGRILVLDAIEPTHVDGDQAIYEVRRRQVVGGTGYDIQDGERWEVTARADTAGGHPEKAVAMFREKGAR